MNRMRGTGSSPPTNAIGTDAAKSGQFRLKSTWPARAKRQAPIVTTKMLQARDTMGIVAGSGSHSASSAV